MSSAKKDQVEWLRSQGDMSFIAEAHNAMPALLKYIDRLERVATLVPIIQDLEDRGERDASPEELKEALGSKITPSQLLLLMPSFPAYAKHHIMALHGHGNVGSTDSESSGEV